MSSWKANLSRSSRTRSRVAVIDSPGGRRGGGWRAVGGTAARVSLSGRPGRLMARAQSRVELSEFRRHASTRADDPPGRAPRPAASGPALWLSDGPLELLEAAFDLVQRGEDLLVLLLLDVRFSRRVLERQSIALGRPVAREQDQRRRVGGLRREREVEEDERGKDRSGTARRRCRRSRA